jgi:hypothetical protein
MSEFISVLKKNELNYFIVLSHYPMRVADPDTALQRGQ